jgi:hypothetical protein
MKSLVAYPCGQQFPVLLLDNIESGHRGGTMVYGSLPSYLTVDQLNDLLAALTALPEPFFKAAFLSTEYETEFRAKVEAPVSPRKDGIDGFALELSSPEGKPPRMDSGKVPRHGRGPLGQP